MHILLVEDEPKIAAFVELGLKGAGHTVVRCPNAEQGLLARRGAAFDAMVVDIMLPGVDGLSFIELVRKQQDWTPVLVLSARQSVDDRVRGLKAGGDDYLTKPFAMPELLARLEALARRKSAVPAKGAGGDEKTLSACGLHLDLMTRKVARGKRQVVLQPLEFMLLAYMVRNTGQVVSRKMIMDNVWDCDVGMQTNVVEVRMCRLREKLTQAQYGEKELIHTLRGIGYVLRENP